ncbi:hypothetical protein [Mucilaginibacter sp.]|uniref:hypothetical protein n=1 Tax=Mucilaginibacter sp. TaxID=1882438 RepID=UPI0026264C09|nr:hypothetical protein [Mucilaginibacter sp.]MDB4922358.1 hypothetical protein [Mucilaginibacter sp.]
MAHKYLKHKWQKISLAVVLVFTVFVLLPALFINSYWSPILEGRVKDIVIKSSDSLYTVSFSSAELHVLRGTIVILNITLKPDTSVYNAKKKAHLAPNNLVELHIKKLVLSRIHPFRLYFRNKLDIGQVMLYNPVLNVSYQLNHTRDTVLKDNRTAWQKISKNLHYIHIGDILMGDVKFMYKDYSGNKLVISQLKEMNLSAHDLLIDSATQTDKSRVLYCKDITAELNNYNGKTPNGLYSYNIKSLKLSTSKSQLTVSGLILKPAATEIFFNESHRDRFTFRLDSAQLRNFDYITYHKYRSLTASKLILSNGSLQIFANPNHLKKKEDKIRSFPNVALNNISTDIKIDTVLLHYINITYNEFNVDSKKTGTLTFNNTNGRALNITNNKAALKKNNISTILLSTYFMNRGKFDADINFNLTDKNNSFGVKGKLGPMNLQALNQAVMPLGMIKINSGTLNQFDFDIKANRNGAEGKVELLYNDAKITMLKADTTNDKLKRKTIASLYTNIFILKHNNPDKPGMQPRIVYVNFVRKPENAFFKTIWKTLLNGLKPSIGFDKKTEQAMIYMLNQQEINKQNHKIKKEQRKERRAERQRKKEKKRLETGG